jgi:hypothetical protein
MTRTLLLAAFLATALDGAANGRIIIVNQDAPRIGFNDTTPVEPVGGNPGRTLGEQRLNVFHAAARRWNTLLDVEVDILVQASFSPIAGCTSTRGVLGQAGPLSWQRDFTAAPMANVWYPIALANQLAGRDLAPTAGDIFVQFNADVDNDVCLGTSDWYYGLDGKAGDHTDLFVVVLHELGHGFGLSGALRAPSFRDNLPAIFDVHTYDRSLGARWSQMSLEQRRVSLTNTGNLVWIGDHVRGATDHYADHLTVLEVTAPAPLARQFEVGRATFGGAIAHGSSGAVVRATDGANPDGPSTSDGCTAFTNAAAVAGKIALLDRGDCTFVAKARNAQAAGAIGMIVADNDRDQCSPPTPGGAADDVTIPVVGITARDGDAFKTQLNGNAAVAATLREDVTRRAATSPEGNLRLYAPCEDEPGSSVHHWDTSASPNLLMEPSVSSDLRHGVDITLDQLYDLGWKPRERTWRPVR